jgi:DNA-binding SARP family transcriptional activator/tetratricopeptide (TPR) repeat protein
VELEFRAFGPLAISRDGAEVPMASRLRQILLAVLLVHRGSVVPMSTLITSMWPSGPPATPAKSLHIHIHRLRRALGGTGTVRHCPPGYALVVAPDRVDIHRFDELVRRGREALDTGAERTAKDLLREAAALCRGPAFQGLEDVPALAAEADHLEDLRLAALEGRMAAELALGEHTSVVADLSRLVAEQPLRERFRAQLMIALYRAGRKADALAVFRDGRRMLVEELGIEPNAECRELERAILVDDPGLDLQRRPDRGPHRTDQASPVPRQLPPDVATFTGRTAELQQLDDLLADVATYRPSSVGILAIEGAAGTGKTALAVHWGHRVAGRFPDGQLYVNLRGYAPGTPLRPVEAMAMCLRGLGLPAEQVPAEVEEASSRYRSLLADRRMLVLLDNAATADQVRPLLPGAGGSLVMVTSRDRLSGLVAQDGARPVRLGLLPPEESHVLLSRLVGAERMAAEPEPAAELANRCGHLPLALRIAAANLIAHPGHTIAFHTAQLRMGRLAALAVAGDGQASVAAAFDLSYTRLPNRARRMFRRLGLLPGPDITAEAAAALAGTTPTGARVALERLAGAHLVEEPAAGRYALHDLLRRYAADLAGQADSAGDRSGALTRLYRWYLAGTDAAARVVTPHMPRLADPVDARDLATPQFADQHEALTWLDSERPNLVTAVVAAAGAQRQLAVALCAALRGHLVLRHQVVDLGTVATAVLAAADRHDDPRAQAAARLALGSAAFAQRRLPQAISEHAAALTQSRQAGWEAGTVSALCNLGTTQWELGELDKAAAHFADALVIERRASRLPAQARLLTLVGVIHAERGRLGRAAEHFRSALLIDAELGQDLSLAIDYDSLGHVLHALGRLDDAGDHLGRALRSFREAGYRSGEACTLDNLAAVHRDAGRLGQALGCAGSSAAIAREIRAERIEAEATNTLATIFERLGHYPPAIDHHRHALRLAVAAGSRSTQISAKVGLAVAMVNDGHPELAMTHAEPARLMAVTAGYLVLEGEALTALARTRLAMGERSSAAELARQAIERQRRSGHRLGEAESLRILAAARG